MERFGESIKELLRYVSARGLGRVGGVSDSTIWRWDSGADVPNDKVKKEFADRLCLPPRHLDEKWPFSARYIEWLKKKAKPSGQDLPPYSPDANDKVLELAAILVVQSEAHTAVLRDLLSTLQAQPPEASRDVG